MGNTTAAPVNAVFSTLKSWPLVRVAAIIKAYKEGDFDFGFDASSLIALSGIDEDKVMYIYIAYPYYAVANNICYRLPLLLLYDSCCCITTYMQYSGCYVTFCVNISYCTHIHLLL